MKKSIILFFLVIIPISLFSQANGDKITYSAEGVYFTIYNDDGTVFSEKPIGKLVKIVFDPFFKSYELSYTDENEKIITRKYSFVKNLENNRIQVKDSRPFTGIIYIEDYISETGQLLILARSNFHKEKDGKKLKYRDTILKVTGASKQ